MALETEDALKSSGFSAVCGATGGVLVERGGHARGIWHFSGGSYYWTPAGYGAPVARVASIAEAVAHTISVMSAA